MKKTSFVLFSALAISGLTACGQGNETPVNENTNTNTGGADEVEENLDNTSEENDEASGESSAQASSGPENANEENENAAENNEHNESEENNEHNNGADEEENSTGNNESSDNDGEEANTASANEDEEAAMVYPLYLYFSDDQLLEILKVEADPVTMNEAGAAEAMDLWAAGPEEDGLYGVLPSDADVQYVELDGDTAYVSLSPEVENANLGSSGEALLTEQIAMMMEQFGTSQTMILIDGEETEVFLGHMDLSDPVEADSPEDYDTN